MYYNILLYYYITASKNLLLKTSVSFKKWAADERFFWTNQIYTTWSKTKIATHSDRTIVGQIIIGIVSKQNQENIFNYGNLLCDMRVDVNNLNFQATTQRAPYQL